MYLIIATLVIMAACAWSQYRNGLFTSVAMLIKVILAGVVAFNFFEPIADFLDPVFQKNMLEGTEDFIGLIVLFGLTLFVLRLISNHAAPDMIDHHGWVQYFGGAAIGVVTGYLVSGFLICAMETLPLEDKFMDFQPRAVSEPGYRGILPPDRTWLALMRHAGAVPFSWKEEPRPAGNAAVDRYLTFDRDASFELRYQRFRRGGAIYMGEFDRELYRPPAP